MGKGTTDFCEMVMCCSAAAVCIMLKCMEKKKFLCYNTIYIYKYIFYKWNKKKKKIVKIFTVNNVAHYQEWKKKKAEKKTKQTIAHDTFFEIQSCRKRMAWFYL